MRTILVGYGEIGQALSKTFDIDEVYDTKMATKPTGTFDLLLIAIPYSKTFVKSVKKYQKEYNVQATLIFSTVPIGTCSQLGASHCPVEGRHPDLAKSLEVSYKWLGGHNDLCFKFLRMGGFRVMHVDHPEFTEFLKLQSTAKYGLNIEFARYVKACCDDMEMNYDMVKEWDRWYNELYAELDIDWAKKFVLDPPVGPKGGHCIVPNAKILNEQFPHDLVRIVAEEECESVLSATSVSAGTEASATN